MAGKKESMTIIVFSGEFDRVYAAFILATTAASMGMKVTMYFTFWGLNVIKKKAVSGKGISLSRAMNAMNRGGLGSLPLSKFDFFGAGRMMMKKFMKDKNMPSLKEMIKTAKKLGVKFIACTTSTEVMGLSREDFIPEVDVHAGAAAYLNEARKASVNLFI